MQNHSNSVIEKGKYFLKTLDEYLGLILAQILIQ